MFIRVVETALVAFPNTPVLQCSKHLSIFADEGKYFYSRPKNLVSGTLMRLL